MNLSIQVRLRRALPLVIMCLGLAGCEADNNLNRSLYFFTHTTGGVEVSFAPAEANGPITAVVGYRRVEGVMNPVYQPHPSRLSVDNPTFDQTLAQNTSQSTYAGQFYRPKAFSVIATFNAKGETKLPNGDIVAGGNQIFATGLAADLIAKQPLTAAALTQARPATADAINAARGLTKLSSGDRFPDTREFYAVLYRLLQTTSDPEIVALRLEMDSLATLLPAKYADFQFKYVPASPFFAPEPGSLATGQPVPRGNGFDSVGDYLDVLAQSLRSLDDAADEAESVGDAAALAEIRRQERRVSGEVVRMSDAIEATGVLDRVRAAF